MLTSLIVSLVLSLGLMGEGEEMVVGQITDHDASLIGPPGHDFYGVKIAVRRHHPCQVRAFFHGAPPRAAQFCAGRVTSRHIAEAATGVLDPGDRVNGVSACFTEDEQVGAIRLYRFSGEAVTARAGACVTEYRTVWCQRGWTVQGLQLYFDGPSGGRSHASLVGMRPLCVDST
ncbi:hypothetical protein [Maricaulis sp.]|uniref:hypothetical protein n=1 Tax=Maricaulis sp. TaxID=1486257 RepID=UPI0025BF4E98|nr:hypothetical protein [Maricaulis sp.]